MKYEVKRCLFCGRQEELKELYPRNFKDEELTAAVFSARRFTDRFHYRTVRCQKCGLVFSREILPDDVLAQLYAGSTVTFGEYADIIRRDYLRPLEPYLKKINKGRALEIGCSSGFFLEELLALGFKDVQGCEPSLEAKAQAAKLIKDKITTGFFRLGLYPKASFDLVCSFQTLDHLSDPLSAVRTCREILRPGGYAYFITHDVRGLQARLLRDKSPIIDVEHIYLFDKSTLRRLLEEAGLQVIEVGNLKNSYPLDYWLRLLFKGGRLGSLLIGLAKILRLGQLALPLSAGNIYIIAQKK
jgi:SAM-dependent methyltransferase